METENETEEEEMQPAQNDNNFLSSGHYDLDIEMLPNESVEIHARDGGGLLQVNEWFVIIIKCFFFLDS